jgi:hypothetical protein
MNNGRRSLLKAGAVTGLGVGLGALGLRSASATTWADLPAGIWPSGYTPPKILEIFCYSGLSQWENFWVAENIPGTLDWQNFQTDVTNLHWHCGANPATSTQTLTFGNDLAGTRIDWGPATSPLWRSDIFSKVRMVTMSHDFPVHEIGTPLALTGHRLGNPRLAGKGAAIQHRMMSMAPRATPYSYVLVPDDLGAFGFGESAIAANGMHPGYAQPLTIKIGDSSFQTLLQRSQMSGEADQLIRSYQATSRDHLRFHGINDPVRSSGFGSWSTAVDEVQNARNLNTLLSGVNLTVSNGRLCATNAVLEPAQAPNKVRVSLDLATMLLTSGGAQYVGVFDRGTNNDIGSPYDTHFPQNEQITATNLFNLCSLLADRIDATGADPTKINLSNTLIVIHSEFGRTPLIGVGGGRDHWPFGYAAILIGGPIGTRSIGGAIDSGGSAVANVGDFSPTDVHGAVLMAAGIDPFAPENFGVQEFSTNVSDGTETGTRAALKQKILNL